MRTLSLALVLWGCDPIGAADVGDKTAAMRLAFDAIVAPGATPLLPLTPTDRLVDVDGWAASVAPLGDGRHLVVLAPPGDGAEAAGYALVGADGAVTLLRAEGLDGRSDGAATGLADVTAVAVGEQVVLARCADPYVDPLDAGGFLVVDPAAGTVAPGVGACRGGTFGPAPGGVVAVGRPVAGGGLQADRYVVDAAGMRLSGSEALAEDPLGHATPIAATAGPGGALAWIGVVLATGRYDFAWRDESTGDRLEVSSPTLAWSGWSAATAARTVRWSGSGAVDGLTWDGRLERWHVDSDGSVQVLDEAPPEPGRGWGPPTGFGAAVEAGLPEPSRAPDPVTARDVVGGAFVVDALPATPCVEAADCYFFGEYRLLAVAGLAEAPVGVWLVWPWEQVSPRDADDFVGVYVVPFPRADD